jgi:hypothetical protein
MADVMRPREQALETVPPEGRCQYIFERKEV